LDATDQTIAVMISYFIVMIVIGAISAKRVTGLDEFHLAGRRVR
jgi:Na+/proline symporter